MSSSIAGRRQSSNSDEHPPSKRIRCAASIEEDVGHPIEDDATAKRKLREAGFDPDRASELVEGSQLRDFPGSADITPIIYFSYRGDLPMCRYLYDQGAERDVTKTCSGGFWFPMYAAAQKGHLALCQWLYDRGAAKDAYRRCGRGFDVAGAWWSPLKTAWSKGHADVSKWLILNGALHGGGAFNARHAVNDLIFNHNEDSVSEMEFETRLSALKSWVLDTAASHDAFHMFLMGTLPLRANDCSAAVQSILSRNLRSEKAASLLIKNTPPEDYILLLHELSSPLLVLGGFPEILELVADFVGVVKQRRGHDRLRDLAAFFPKPSGKAESDDSSECLCGVEYGEEDDLSTDEGRSDESSDGYLYWAEHSEN